MKNYGVIIKKPRPTDYRVGGETGIVYKENIPSGDWSNFLPTDETQSTNLVETMACVTFSALNIIESQLNWMMSTGGLTADTIKKLTDWGYIENGRFNFSDRYTAKMSGTTTNGNTLTNVSDSIRKDGLVPEKLWSWSKESFDWNTYYGAIPQSIVNFGQNILTLFDFAYEWVTIGSCNQTPIDQIKAGLKQAPLQITSPVCNWNENIVQPCGTCKCQHATMLYYLPSDCVCDFDSYIPTRKKLALNYTIPYVLKLIVTPKTVTSLPSIYHIFNIDMQYGQTNEEIVYLQDTLKLLGFLKSTIISSGYYGELTRQAVFAFQTKYLQLSWWEKYVLCGKTVGYKTRTKLNSLK